MTTINDRISINTVISASVLAQASYDLILLGDHADFGDSYGGTVIITDPDDLTAATKQKDFATVFFGQKRKPRQLILCRVNNAAGADDYTDALIAARAAGTDFWAVAQIGASEAQIVSLSTNIETKREFLVISSDDSDIPTTSTTDLASLVKGNDRTMVIYTEFADTNIKHFIDASVMGTILPTVYNQQAVSFSWQELKLIGESGALAPISASARTYIEGKNCNHIEALGGYNLCRKGVTSNNVPAYLILHCDKLNNDLQADFFQVFMAKDVMAYDVETLALLEGLTRSHFEAAVKKRVIVDTEEDPIIWNFPVPSDFSSTVRATGTLNLPNVAIARMNYPVLEVVMTSTWQI